MTDSSTRKGTSMTSKKKNCWEYMKCGREPGGRNVHKLGVCPASTETRANGINGGKNAGRVCWVMAGTFCKGKVQGTFAKKMTTCLECEFYKHVWKEEGVRLCSDSDLMNSLKMKRVEE